MIVSHTGDDGDIVKFRNFEKSRYFRHFEFLKKSNFLKLHLALRCVYFVYPDSTSFRTSNSEANKLITTHAWISACVKSAPSSQWRERALMLQRNAFICLLWTPTWNVLRVWGGTRVCQPVQGSAFVDRRHGDEQRKTSTGHHCRQSRWAEQIYGICEVLTILCLPDCFPDVIQFFSGPSPPLCGLLATNFERMPALSLIRSAILESMGRSETLSCLTYLSSARFTLFLYIFISNSILRTADRTCLSIP